ncbi:hypothetical protein ACQPXH_33065 (plasmid) [Nocardia sp. CA-135953]|uniref:hypothetical protein n=1 Tax=Nocardia sp. CA-135953 TaxID=3239978 RepID=UPI003D971005
MPDPLLALFAAADWARLANPDFAVDELGDFAPALWIAEALVAVILSPLAWPLLPLDFVIALPPSSFLPPVIRLPPARAGGKTEDETGYSPHWLLTVSPRGRTLGRLANRARGHAMLRYRCLNPWCLDSWHYTSSCPRSLVQDAPTGITPGKLEAGRRIHAAAQAGAFDSGPWYPRIGFANRPPSSRGAGRRWRWGLALAALLLLVLVIYL